MNNTNIKIISFNFEVFHFYTEQVARTIDLEMSDDKGKLLLMKFKY